MLRIVEVVIRSLAFGDQAVEGGDSARKSTVKVLHLCGVRVEPESCPDTTTAVRRSLGCVRLAAVGAEPVAWAERDVLTIAVRQSGKAPSIVGTVSGSNARLTALPAHGLKEMLS